MGNIWVIGIRELIFFLVWIVFLYFLKVDLIINLLNVFLNIINLVLIYNFKI